MKQCKRLFSAVLLLCFALSIFPPLPSFAQEQNPPSGTQTAVQNTQTDSGDSDDEELNEDDEKNSDPATDSDLDITTDSAIDATTEQAIDTTTGTAIDTGSGKSTTGQAIGQTTKTAIEAAPPKKEDESVWYRKQNPMKKEHQKLLWDYCKKRGLDYIDMLSLISLESNFDEKCSSGKYFGYFQISKGNCAILAATLKTKNKPLDGAININWGTTYFSWIIQDKRVKGLTGKKKRDVSLSIYQRGTGGYDKSGLSTKFLNNFYKKRKTVCSWYGIDS